MSVMSRRAEGRTSSTQLRSVAVHYLLEEAERTGLALSSEVQAVVERQCATLFDYKRDPARAVEFSQSLKEIAVRLFRQRRYREADSRYRIAAVFNPADPTLISNRATCMYNLAMYRKCADLCLDCVTNFQSLFYEKPMLYFKVLLRMGRAHVEMGDLADAQSTLEALIDMKNSFPSLTASLSSSSSMNPETQQNQLQEMLQPFEKRLKSRLAYEQDSAISAGREGAAKDQHEDVYLDEGEDDNVHGILELSDLCPHVFEFGEGECNHDFPEGVPHGPKCNCARHNDMHPGKASDSVSENNSVPSLVSGSEESMDGNDNDVSTDAMSEDSKIPDLVSDEDDMFDSADDADDDDDTYSDENESSDVEVENPVAPKSGTNAQPTAGPVKTRGQVKSAPIDWRNAWKETRSTKLESAAPSASGSSQSTQLSNSSPPKAGSLAAGFKRGFFDSRPLFLDSSAPTPSAGERPATIIASPKWNAVCYETDQETGPVGSGLHLERTEEDRDLLELERNTKSGPQGAFLDVRPILREVLGKSFQSSRTIDFSRLFGHHQIAHTGGKRKKKACDKHCGTCFARKMWRSRFFCSDGLEAEIALAEVDSDSRREHDTFLTSELWQGTGYYASGYEMAYDVPALVHGVAYTCHLQAELCWRGDKISFVKDAEHSFIASLERTYKEQRNLHFLFLIYFMIRDTVSLFSILPNANDDHARRSFQFSNNASTVASKAIPSDGAGSSAGIAQALLGSRSESLSGNVHKWSMLGQVAKEEAWIYNILLRDLSHLIMRVSGTAPRPPLYLEGESFSEAFEKACGERAHDERYWKIRIATIIARERSRLIERHAYEAKTNGDLEKSVATYTVALQARPRQGRLYYRRAVVRSEQRKWRECLNDIHKGVSIVNERPQGVFSTRCDAPHKCLLRSLYMLEGDVLLERSKEPGDNAIDSTKVAMESYTKAIHIRSEDRQIRAMIEQRLNVAKKSFKKAQFASSRESIGTAVDVEQMTAKRGKGRKQRRAAEELLQTTGAYAPPNGRNGKEVRRSWPLPRENTNDSSSDDDEYSPGGFAGNRYGALREEAVASNASRAAPSVPTADGPSSNLGGWETVGRMLARGNHSSSSSQAGLRQQSGVDNRVHSEIHRTHAHPTNRTHLRNLPASSASSASSAATGQYQCQLCNMQFGGAIDYNSHVRGRRHRTAVGRARVSGNRAENSSGHVRDRGNVVATSDNSRGPTIAEAAVEAERVMVILGGEARPSDVVSRMSFSRWGIQDVNGYLDSNFGGLLQICNQHPQKFEVVHSRARTMLVLTERTGLASNRHRTGGRRTAPMARAFDNRRSNNMQPASGWGTGGSSNRLSDVNKMLNNTRISARSAKEVISGEYEEGECGICMDSKEDVRIIPCQHKWCERCIMANLAKGRMVCPACNGPVRNLERLSNELD